MDNLSEQDTHFINIALSIDSLIRLGLAAKTKSGGHYITEKGLDKLACYERGTITYEELMEGT